mmetsp:Transcript_25568/g.101942  ORF Transcript_25568/g.101942 Transcript_25568/m.101942 type:complete len:266 (+) Transcript_25568:388-1185(+)
MSSGAPLQPRWMLCCRRRRVGDDVRRRRRRRRRPPRGGLVVRSMEEVAAGGLRGRVARRAVRDERVVARGAAAEERGDVGEGRAPRDDEVGAVGEVEEVDEGELLAARRPRVVPASLPVEHRAVDTRDAAATRARVERAQAVGVVACDVERRLARLSRCRVARREVGVEVGHVALTRAARARRAPRAHVDADVGDGGCRRRRRRRRLRRTARCSVEGGWSLLLHWQQQERCAATTRGPLFSFIFSPSEPVTLIARSKSPPPGIHC